MTEIHSPFRYPGGKYYARKLIMQYIPTHYAYIEPFAGGASIFFAKPKTKYNLINDADQELVNCYLHIRDHVEALIAFLDGLPATKELHRFYKNEFQPQNNLERAGRWYYLNRTSYSGIMNMQNCYWGYGDKYSMRPENWGRQLRKCANKLQEVEITSSDFETVIDNVPDNAFLFVDPPYFNADQDKFYTHSFSHIDHHRLEAALARNQHRIQFLLTYDDAPQIRILYRWATAVQEEQWNYTINRTDDQKTRTDTKGTRYRGQEIFIMNYTTETPSLPIEQLRLFE
jgi:DNA adenine methylase